MSGIAAAAALHEAGRTFLVLEQAAQIGGRMRAVKFGGDIIEEGANWYDTELGEILYGVLRLPYCQ